MPKVHSRGNEQQDWVRASEVGQYTFCARAWWLQQVCGVQPDDDRPLYAGDMAHRRHGFQVQVADVSRWVALLLLALAVAALLVAMVAG